MKQDIRFRGLSLDRDELAADHGELALCGNVELHDGSLRPSVLKGTTIAQDDTDGFEDKLLFVHESGDYTNFITVGQPGLRCAIPKTDGSGWNYHTILAANQFQSIRSISSVGNTLCILADTGLWYALFKDGAYILLGQQPPFAELQFGLRQEGNDSDNNQLYQISLGDMNVGLIYTVKADYVYDVGVTPNGLFSILEAQRSSITEQVMGIINKRISEAAENQQFYAPFLVRYCYRLYDGAMIMHSAPVLMAPSLERNVMVSIRRLMIYNVQNDRYYVTNYPDEHYDVKMFMQLGKLEAQWVNPEIKAELLKWGDIVKSVDIFITPQFARLDSSGLIETIKKASNNTSYISVRSLMDGKDNNRFQAAFLATTSATRDGYSTIYNDEYFVLPEYSEDDYLSRIRNASEFYHVASYNIDGLSHFEAEVGDPFHDVELKVANLFDVVTQPQMTDDYKTHNILRPASQTAHLYTYNHRLHVYSISEKLFSGFSPKVLFAYVDDDIHLDGNQKSYVAEIDVFIRDGGGLKKVKWGDYVNGSSVAYLNWQRDLSFFYPDARATSLIFKGTEYYNMKCFTLYGHGSLNGAVIDHEDPDSTYYRDLLDMAVNDMSNLRGKIYTSRTDNPFYFPNLPGESGINTIGTGDIIGIAAVTRALSPGQVGDHDLLVFATDGIWAMKVSSTGTYTDMHNISREVCTNPESICQLDQSVIFATKRSLSQIRESDAVSISDALDGPIPDLADMLPALADALTDGSEQDALLCFGTPAVSMFQTGKVLYDFASSRLLVFDDSYQGSHIALVFSLKDMAWSTMCTGYVRAAVPGYPSPYVEVDVYDEEQSRTLERDVWITRIIRLDQPYDHDTGIGRKGIIVTRTLAFSDTMDVIRGFRQYCQCETMPTLYFFGSDDQLSWQYIGHSERAFHNYIPGHPFRFFRVAMLLDMKMSERYQALALEVINKYAKL